MRVCVCVFGWRPPENICVFACCPSPVPPPNSPFLLSCLFDFFIIHLLICVCVKMRTLLAASSSAAAVSLWCFIFYFVVLYLENLWKWFAGVGNLHIGWRGGCLALTDWLRHEKCLQQQTMTMMMRLLYFAVNVCVCVRGWGDAGGVRREKKKNEELWDSERWIQPDFFHANNSSQVICDNLKRITLHHICHEYE